MFQRFCFYGVLKNALNTNTFKAFEIVQKYNFLLLSISISIYQPYIFVIILAHNIKEILIKFLIM